MRESPSILTAKPYRHPDVPGSHDWDASQTRMATLAHFKTRLPTSFSRIYSRDLEAEGSFGGTEGLIEENLFVLNTHFDDRGRISRQKAAEIIRKKLGPVARSNIDGKYSLVVLMGDLNSPASEEGYQVLTGYRYVKGRPEGIDTFMDSRHALVKRAVKKPSSRNLPEPLLHRAYGSQGTFTDFRARSDGGIIDYIMLADNGVVEGSGETASHKPRWRVTKYGVLPNKVEDGIYPFRLSDHCMVSTTLSRLL